MIGHRLLITVTFIAASLCAGIAWSDDKDANIAELLKGAKVTIDQAIKAALEKAPGTAVEAELEKKHDKTVWEVEVVGADGKTSEVHVDAATGAVIDVEAKKAEKEKEKDKKKEGKKGK